MPPNRIANKPFDCCVKKNGFGVFLTEVKHVGA